MQTIYKDIQNKIKALDPDKRILFIANVARLLAVRPHRFSEDYVSNKTINQG